MGRAGMGLHAGLGQRCSRRRSSSSSSSGGNASSDSALSSVSQERSRQAAAQCRARTLSPTAPACVQGVSAQRVQEPLRCVRSGCEDHGRMGSALRRSHQDPGSASLSARICGCARPGRCPTGKGRCKPMRLPTVWAARQPLLTFRMDQSRLQMYFCPHVRACEHGQGCAWRHQCAVLHQYLGKTDSYCRANRRRLLHASEVRRSDE